MKTSWPLRWRIAAWAALATGVALVTFTAVVAFNLYTEQVEMIDDRLATDALLVAARDAGEPDTTPLVALAVNPAKRGHNPAETALYGFALMRIRDGVLIRAQPALLAGTWAHWPPGRWPPHRHFFNVTIEHTRLRVGAFPRGEMTLLLAAPLEPATESVEDLLGAALIAFPAVLLVVAGGSWWIARRALQPIQHITEAAASITADRLGERLPAPEIEDEIGRHIRVLNGMFDRLQRSFEQATRFTADASHELRTPLTIMRGQLEDALRSGTNTTEQEHLLVDLLDETSALQKTAENLLLLTRFDAGKSPLQREPLDWSSLVAEAGEDAELLAAPRHLRIETEIAPGVRVLGDATMLRRVLLNLIDNAVKYNRADGWVRLTLSMANGFATVTVANTGSGIPPERRPALFERFYRLDFDRNRDTGGSGLGLSLCREIVTAHDGTITLGQTAADWTEFVVRLPVLAGSA
ncbi:MAG TPA: ATP-binding protein [Opitutaceae bacterium]|nr:ATP-binding protein [Opitutaceae bacterium]